MQYVVIGISYGHAPRTVQSLPMSAIDAERHKNYMKKDNPMWTFVVRKLDDA